MIPKTIIHLLSGGLDSVTLLHDLVNQGHHVHALIFDYGQKHKREIEFAMAHAKQTRVAVTLKTLPALGRVHNWIVPNRNAIFLSVAVNVAFQAKADTVTIGCNADDSEARAKGSQQMIWGIIGMVIMVSAIVIKEIIANTVTKL
jgi:7-cyano-7-deazaguanine synthase